MDKTLDDFWLMVWLHRVNRIVMVTKLIEGGVRVGYSMITVDHYAFHTKC